VASTWGWQPHHLLVLNVMKAWSLNLLEPSGPHRTCYGTPLPLPLPQCCAAPSFLALRYVPWLMARDLFYLDLPGKCHGNTTNWATTSSCDNLSTSLNHYSYCHPVLDRPTGSSGPESVKNKVNSVLDGGEYLSLSLQTLYSLEKEHASYIWGWSWVSVLFGGEVKG
jgi:hypothetical protein